jgi:uncharacterized RDD family membrane protein YckC
MEFHPNDLSDLDDLTEEHLGFAALSDGLGFSKKKESAPAAPAPQSIPDFDLDEEDRALLSSSAAPAPSVKKPAPWMGTGAVAAGPAWPAPSIAPKPAATLAASTPTPTAAAKVLAEPAAPQGLRVSAFFLDALLVFTPLAATWMFSFGDLAGEIFREDITSPLLLAAAIFVAYFLLSESFGGQSLGKMAFGLQVVEDDKYQKPTGLKHAFVRLLLLAAGGPLLIGLLASYWDKKRRPWQDRFSGSIVRQVK